jgi:hypothetical protein
LLSNDLDPAPGGIAGAALGSVFVEPLASGVGGGEAGWLFGDPLNRALVDLHKEAESTAHQPICPELGRVGCEKPLGCETVNDLGQIDCCGCDPHPESSSV